MATRTVSDLKSELSEAVKNSRAVIDAATTVQRPAGLVLRAASEVIRVPESAVKLEPASPTDSTSE